MARKALSLATPLPQPHQPTAAPARPHAETHPMLKALANAEYGELRLAIPTGAERVFRGARPGPQAVMQLHSWKPFDALIARGEMGFAESYMQGEWDSPDLTAVMAYGLANAGALEKYFYGRPAYALWTRLQRLLHLNSVSGSRHNIMAHYDLGNAFYALWLDDSMTYSCALFDGNRQMSLEEAQQAKYRRILSKLDARPGDHILEIGCGWGGFAEAAARAGFRVTAITISQAQKVYAEMRLQRAGLSHLATAVLTDYREVQGEFDHIVSIGMFEHVGERYWPAYFNAIRKHLKPGGTAMVQSIMLDEDTFERTRGKSGFIETCIFPGGQLPSRPRFRQAAEKAGLHCEEMFAFGQNYILTLKEWLKRFNAREKEVRLMGYDEQFIRMWRLYLCACIASFATARSDVMQAKLVHAA